MALRPTISHPDCLLFAGHFDICPWVSFWKTHSPRSLKGFNASCNFITHLRAGRFSEHTPQIYDSKSPSSTKPVVGYNYSILNSTQKYPESWVNHSDLFSWNSGAVGCWPWLAWGFLPLPVAMAPPKARPHVRPAPKPPAFGGPRHLPGGQDMRNSMKQLEQKYFLDQQFYTCYMHYITIPYGT